MNKILKGVLVVAAVISMLGLSAPANPPPMLDEDDMVSDDDTCVATQQSIKKYVDDNAGAWAKISTQTASGSATIDFTTLSASYRDFKIIGSGVVPATDNVELRMRISVASTFKSGAADYAWSNYYHTPTSSGQLGDASDSEINLFNAAGSAAGESVSFEMVLYDPAGTALRKPILGTSGGQNNLATYTSRSVAGYYIAATSAIDGIQFLFSSGNIESGTFTLYGRSN